MPRMKIRRGVGLAELLVALTLAAILSAAGVAALASTERYVRRARATSDARRNLREASAVLASELRAATPDSLHVRGDTAVDFPGIVGVSVACVSAGNVLVLPPDVAASGVPYSSWRATPELGDVVALFDTAGAGGWRTALVDTASTRADGAGCKPSSGLLSAADSAARRPVMRVVLQSSPNPEVPVGTPVRVLRSGRYALTRAGDGSWSLSYRRCAGSLCGVAQPVAGPFAAPADSGLVFTNVAGDSRVDAALRTTSAATQASPQAVQLRLTLRNRGGVP
jgi:type II secretory pathway pseudopilin PulG